MLRDEALFKKVFNIASHAAYGSKADKGGVNVQGPSWAGWIREQSPSWLVDANIAARTGKTWPDLREFSHAFIALYQRDQDATRRYNKFAFFAVILSDTPVVLPPVFLAYETITQEDIDFIQQKVGMVLTPMVDNLMRVDWLA